MFQALGAPARPPGQAAATQNSQHQVSIQTTSYCSNLGFLVEIFKRRPWVLVFLCFKVPNEPKVDLTW